MSLLPSAYGKSARGLANSKTWRRFNRDEKCREASWNAPVLCRFGMESNNFTATLNMRHNERDMTLSGTDGKITNSLKFVSIRPFTVLIPRF